MTVQRSLNSGGFGSNFTMWELKEILKAAGWTVESSGSGNGGIYEAAGDVFDPVDNPKKNSDCTAIGSGSGSEHFGYDGCWFRMSDPDGNREILARRRNTNGDPYDAYWWLGWSESAGFVGGTPNATTPPDATDERPMTSSGTKASPGNIGASGTMAVLNQSAADDAASPAGEYGFIVFEFVGTNTMSLIIMLDDLRDTAAGDPCPLVIGTAEASLTMSGLYGTGYDLQAVFDNGGAGESYENARYACNYPAAVYSLRGGVSVYDSLERTLPYPVVGYNVGGYIGMSRWFRQPGAQRDYPNTGDSETILYVDEICVVDLLDGVTTPNAI